MMKKIKTMFLAIASILMIAASCAKIDSVYDSRVIPTNDRGEYAIVFTDKVMTKSIADPSTTHDYTSFEVYAWQDGTATAWSPYTVEKSGNEWKYDGIGTQGLQYFDRNTDKYDFLGVITGGTVAPANGSVGLNVTGVKAFENNDDETTTPDELLWAQASVEKAAYDSEVALKFNHANAKMYIGFVSDRNDTQILDYTPSTGGTPDQPIYKLKGNPVAYIGPSVTDAENAGLTDADINYINSLFDFYAPHGYNWIPTTQTWVEINPTDEHWVGTTLISYWSTNNGGNAPQANSQDVYTQFSGDLSFNVWEYIVNKYPAFATMDISQWENTGKLQSNPNAVMKIVHLYKESGSLHAFMINPTNVTTTQIGVIPGTPGTPGINGIRVFSVSKDATTGKNIRTAHTTEASAVLGNNACVLTQTANSGDGADSNITFVKPTGAVTKVADFNSVNDADVTWSPTVWYALPVENPDNGYVVKFSYTYDTNTYYDARVHIPATDSAFKQGKYYRYVICIGNKSNGSTDPGEAGTDKDEVDTDNLPIRFTVVVNAYGDGEFKSYTLAE